MDKTHKNITSLCAVGVEHMIGTYIKIQKEKSIVSEGKWQNQINRNGGGYRCGVEMGLKSGSAQKVEAISLTKKRQKTQNEDQLN